MNINKSFKKSLHNKSLKNMDNFETYLTRFYVIVSASFNHIIYYYYAISRQKYIIKLLE